MSKTYITIQGDTWDMIAKKVYGDEKHLDYLMASNFPLLNYFVFPPGVLINVPELPEKSEGELPVWRR